MGENLNVPIYLDKELVLDLLASLDDGFACAETIRTDDNNVDVSSKKGGVGFNTGLLLGLGLNLGVSKEIHNQRVQAKLQNLENIILMGQ